MNQPIGGIIEGIHIDMMDLPTTLHKSFVHWANGEIHSSQIMLSLLCIEMSGMMDARLGLMFLYWENSY